MQKPSTPLLVIPVLYIGFAIGVLTTLLVLPARATATEREVLQAPPSTLSFPDTRTWEKVGQIKGVSPYPPNYTIFRMKVPSGWYVFTSTGANQGALTFVLDSDHTWE